MKKITLIFILAYVFSLNDYGQDGVQIPKQINPPIPIEAMVGNNSGMYQMIVFQNIGEAQKFSFFNLTTYEDSYSTNAPDYYLIKTIAGYHITRKLNVGLGANFNPIGGFRPLVAVSFTHVTKNYGLIIQPGYELYKDGLAEIFAMFEWSPKNERKIDIYFRVQVMSSFNNQHAYSYHFWRAGMKYKIFKIGPALNVQHVGSEASLHTNFGAFINILLK
jgi:hypothetical protein